VEIVLFVWVVFAILIAAGAAAKGRSGVRWFALAMLLGPLFGSIALLLSPRRGRQQALTTAAPTAVASSAIKSEPSEALRIDPGGSDAKRSGG